MNTNILYVVAWVAVMDMTGRIQYGTFTTVCGSPAEAEGQCREWLDKAMPTAQQTMVGEAAQIADGIILAAALPILASGVNT